MTPPVHDHDVSKLYHEGSADEPPAVLDRAILKAARENIAPVREARKPWWRRFALPLQLAFSVVLVTMLALTVDRNPPEVPAVTERTEPQQAPVPAPIESRPSSPKADRKAEAAPAAIPVPGPSERASAEKAAAEDAAAPVGGQSLEAARTEPAAAGAAPAANRAAVARSPSAWLAAIERLAGTGEKTAARAELEAFRKAYPDYPLPERLEKLLAP
ncbi:MAG: hypothetical protein WCE67_04970 [Azonexus sp.]